MGAIKRAKKNIQIATNKAKVALKAHGIHARKEEKERKKHVQNLQTQGVAIPSEWLIPILDPERNPTPEDLESLLPPPDLLQALLLLEPTDTTGNINVIDPQLLQNTEEVDNFEIHGMLYPIVNADLILNASGIEDQASNDDMVDESDSDGSCVSMDSIMRNADFVDLN